MVFVAGKLRGLCIEGVFKDARLFLLFVGEGQGVYLDVW